MQEIEKQNLKIEISLDELKSIVHAFSTHQDEGIRFQGLIFFSKLGDVEKMMKKGE